MYSFREDAHGHLFAEVPKGSTVAALVSRWWCRLVKGSLVNPWRQCGFAEAAIISTVDLNNRAVWSHSSVVQKSKINVLAVLASFEGWEGRF